RRKRIREREEPGGPRYWPSAPTPRQGRESASAARDVAFALWPTRAATSPPGTRGTRPRQPPAETLPVGPRPRRLPSDLLLNREGIARNRRPGNGQSFRQRFPGPGTAYHKNR